MSVTTAPVLRRRRGMTEQAATAAIDQACRRLRLPTIRALVEEATTVAAKEQLTYAGFLAELLLAECDDRDRRSSMRRVKGAGFPRDKWLGDFDFDANPHINPATIHTLATGDWVRRGQPLCLIGDSGTGKSHLLIGLGTAAAEKGYRVKYTLATRLVNELVEAADDKTLTRTIARYGRVDLLCIDELFSRVGVWSAACGGGPVDDVEEFVEHLVVLGRSSYTVRSYRLGVEHFRRWLEPRPLLEVSRTEIAAYVGAFEAGAGGRAPRTVNQRLAALAAFYAFVIERGTQRGSGRWQSQTNPVPTADGQGLMHGMPGRDLPRRTGLELRRREPRLLPRDLDPAVAERLAAAPVSARDRAIVTLLLRTGQRIGDWSGEHGRHGVLGMRLGDVDRRRRTVTVRLKGARDEHRVPVTDDWWPLLDAYLIGERGTPATDALWVGRRQAAGRPLRYPAFEVMLRATAAALGVRATAHMFRHTVAQQLVDVAGLVVAQQVLGHRHVSTTADTYVHVDEPAMLTALREVAKRQRRSVLQTVPSETRYAFPYSPATIAALDELTGRGAP